MLTDAEKSAVIEVIERDISVLYECISFGLGDSNTKELKYWEKRIITLKKVLCIFEMNLTLDEKIY